MTSEFGKGCTYCLGLFLAHAERTMGMTLKQLDEMDERNEDKENPNYSLATSLWFNGASDHLYELEIPEQFPVALKKRLAKFKHKVLMWGHGFTNTETKEDKKWSIQEAKDILRLIDKQLGVKTMKGQWE